MAVSALEFLITAREEASKVFEKVGGAAEKQKGRMDKFRAAGNIAFAAAGVAAVGFAKSSVEAYTDAQTQQAKLESAYKKFPALADTNIEALRQLNSALEKKTGYDDDEAAAAQATLAQYKLSGDQIAKLTPLLEDYAAKTGKDLPSAAKDLGKAMLGQGKALKNVGLNFTDLKDPTKNFTELMDGLNTQVGGFATDQGKTAAGQSKILSAQFGELQEMAGSKLVPALTKVTDVGIKIVDWLQRTPGAMTAVSVALGVGAVAWAAMTLAASPWLAIGLGIAAVVAGVIVVVKNWNTIGPKVAAIWDGVWTKVKGFFAAGWEVIKKVFSWTPIGLIATQWGAIRDWFGGFVDKFKGFFSGAWDVMKRVFSWTPLGLVTEHFGDILSFFKKLPRKIGDALASVAGALSAPFRAAFSTVAHLWNSTVGKIHFDVPKWVPGVGGKGFSFPTIPGYALGTGWAAPGYAWVGEAGPELVRFRGGEQVVPNSAIGPGRLHPDDIQAIVAGMAAAVAALADRPLQIGDRASGQIFTTGGQHARRTSPGAWKAATT